MSDAGGESPTEGRLGRAQTGKALALVVVAALVTVLVLHHMGASSARPTGSVTAAPVVTTTTTTPNASATVPTPNSTTTTLPLAAPADITVGVVNGLQAGNLATNLTARLKADGYRTLPPDNTTVLTRTSVIYVIRSGYTGEATRLAAQLGLRAGAIQIVGSLPSSAPVPAVSSAGGDLVVVIGTSLQAEASTPPSTVAPPSTTTTRPPSTTTTTQTPSTTTSTVTPATTAPPVPTTPPTSAAPPST